MKYCISILLLLCAAQAFAQKHGEFLFPDEKEDSLSSLTIVQIKNPEVLLKDIGEQLSRDMQQASGLGKYQVEEIFGVNDSEPCMAKCTVSADANLRLRNAKMEGGFSFTGPYHLTSRDSSIIKMVLAQFPEEYPFLSFIESLSISNHSSIQEAIMCMVDAYDVTAYSISDDSGRSVYRINFFPKKTEITQSNSSLYSMMFGGVAYFDSKTMRLSGARIESFINTKNPWLFRAQGTGCSLSFYPFFTEVSSYDAHKQCKIDYEETEGRLTIRQMKLTITKDNKTVTEATIWKLPQ